MIQQSKFTTTNMTLFGKNKHADDQGLQQVRFSVVFEAILVHIELTLLEQSTDNTHHGGHHGGSRLSKTQQQDPYANPNAPTSTQAGTGHGVGGTGNNMGGQGTHGTGPGQFAGNEAGGRHGGAAALPMAPPTDSHGRPINPASTGHGGGGSRLIGKSETAVGSAVGSQSLKARGYAKEQEAGALKAQAGELKEADRLQHEADARRERAVAHGAHPDFGQSGGNRGAGAPNTNQTGGGAGYGQTGTGGTTGRH